MINGNLNKRRCVRAAPLPMALECVSCKLKNLVYKYSHETLEQVREFKYLGWVFSGGGKLNVEFDEQTKPGAW